MRRGGTCREARSGVACSAAGQVRVSAVQVWLMMIHSARFTGNGAAEVWQGARACAERRR